MHQTSSVSASGVTRSIRSGLARAGAELLSGDTLSDERRELVSTMLAGARLSHPLCPPLLPLSVAAMPEATFLRLVPSRSSLASRVAEVLGLLSLMLPPREGQVLAGRYAFQIRQGVVEHVAVAMVDVTALGNRTESSLPSAPVKAHTAAREISLTRPHAVEATIEILRDGVKVDWISEPLCRDSADLHPSTVKNI